MLFPFLLMAFISIYTIKPSYKFQIWLSAILIPIVGIIIEVFHGVTVDNSNISYGSIAGEQTAKSLIPAIISGYIIYSQLKKKFENKNKVKFPLFLVIFVGLSLFFAVIITSLKQSNLLWSSVDLMDLLLLQYGNHIILSMFFLCILLFIFTMIQPVTDVKKNWGLVILNPAVQQPRIRAMSNKTKEEKFQKNMTIILFLLYIVIIAFIIYAIYDFVI